MAEPAARLDPVANEPIAVIETAGCAELKLSEVPPILVGKVYPVKNQAGLSVGKLRRSFPLREGANNVAQNRFLHRFRGVSR